MKKIKQILCKHNYRKKQERKSNFYSGYTAFVNESDYIDILYKCDKCGKEKIKTFNKYLGGVEK